MTEMVELPSLSEEDLRELRIEEIMEHAKEDMSWFDGEDDL